MTHLDQQYRLMNILLAPRVTEKSALVSKHRQYVFKVMNDANKLEVRHAVEKMFNVKVEGVQVSRVKPKTRRFGRIEGRRKGWKKAYVTLAEGHSIQIVTA